MIEYLAAAVLAASPPAGKPDGGTKTLVPASIKHPVEISADKLEILTRKNQAVWVGNVKAVRDSTHLSCKRLVAYYTAAQEVTRIECTGGVEVQDGNRWARGERADFDNVAGVLVVTGSPEARQGPNRMWGSKVTFFIDSDLLQVEQARTVFETAPASRRFSKGTSLKSQDSP